MKPAPPLEKDIQAAILQYLRLRNVFAWRNNSGMQLIPNKGGGMRAIRIGLPGSADILGIMPDGRFLAIEVKRPGKMPTDEQRAFLGQIEANGGVAVVAHSVDDVISLLS